MKLRGPLILIVVAALLLVGAVIVNRQTATANAAAASSRLQTASASRGTIVAMVNAAGNVSTAQTASLNFQTTGRVAQVNVQVGDHVKQGQVLASLDTTDLDLALKSAQATLATAQANLDAARAKYATNNDQVAAAKATLDKATVNLQQAQLAYDKIGGSSLPGIGMTSQSQALASATDAFKTAQANYNTTLSGINDTAVRSAQAQADSAQIAVDQAQSNLAKARIVAPFAGVVSAVNFNPGDTTGAASTAISLIDPANLQVQATVSEVDMPKIKIGDTAEMTLDALPGKTYQARVAKAGPVGTVTSGVVNYTVILTISDADAAVQPGMTANLNIVVDQRDNVLLVPARAVRTQGNRKTVTVLANGQTRQVDVATGVSNDQNVEITRGLQPGDVVVVNATQSTGTNRGGGGFLGPAIR